MNISDVIKVAINEANSYKYSIFIYRNNNDDWCFDFLGRTENCFGDDIKDVVGVLYYNDMKFYDANKMSEWPEEVLQDIARMTIPSVAKEEYEKRLGRSNFEWPI